MELLVVLIIGIAIGAVAGVAVLLGRTEAERRRRQVAIDAELAAARTRAERATSEAQALRLRLATVEAKAARADALAVDRAGARGGDTALHGAVRGGGSLRSTPGVSTRPAPAGGPGSAGVPLTVSRASRTEHDALSSPPPPSPPVQPPIDSPARGAVDAVADAATTAEAATTREAAATPAPAPTARGRRATTPIAPPDPAAQAVVTRADPSEPDSPDRNPSTTDPPGVSAPRSRPRSRSAASGEARAEVAAPSPSDAVTPGEDGPDMPAGGDPVPDGWRPIRPGLADPRRWLGTPAPNGTRYREDDLERIHGVGPYLARRLRDAGVITWRQVAEWDDDDMTLMSRLIGSFPDRIRREDWPASARALHEEAYGEVLP